MLVVLLSYWLECLLHDDKLVYYVHSPDAKDAETLCILTELGFC